MLERLLKLYPEAKETESALAAGPCKGSMSGAAYARPNQVTCLPRRRLPLLRLLRKFAYEGTGEHSPRRSLWGCRNPWGRRRRHSQKARQKPVGPPQPLGSRSLRGSAWYRHNPCRQSPRGGAHWVPQPELDLGSIWGRSRVDLGSIWGRSRVNLGSIRGPSGSDPTSSEGRARVELGWCRGRSGVDLGSNPTASKDPVGSLRGWA